MANYLLRWRLSDASARNLIEKPQDRVSAATSLIESFGGKMNNYFFALGEYDGVGICEFQQPQNVLACSLAARSTGAFQTFETMALLTSKEAQAAMEQAKSTNPRYQAPNA